MMRGEDADWRSSILIEYWSDTVFRRMDRMGYQAVRTDRYKYIRFKELEGMDELYDLESDPFELENRISDPALASLLAELQVELDRLIEESS